MSEANNRDKRYKMLKSAWNQGIIKSFKDILEIVPYYVVATNANLNIKKFLNQMEDIASFEMAELSRMADIMELGFREFSVFMARDLCAMKKESLDPDPEYRFIKVKWENGLIARIKDIFDLVPGRQIFADLEITPLKFKEIMLVPSIITLRQIRTLATLSGISFEELVDFVAHEITEG